ncbi:MAG: phytanoyl-CoA dioxygenase family protein, partial [Spirochaetaceae bacterium]|nr:phytanoyl-CoA dioxygenase family protein [Spirochaetaceae bacterium]
RALANERLLDFAEMVIGPHVQLESITYRRTPPDPAGANPVLGYHRDMFAFFPDDGVYHRPLLFNALSYLQDLTGESGPLRIIPGSHMRALRMTGEEAKRPHPEEVIVYPKAGDVAVFHCSMLHSGSANRSDDYRYLFFLTLNHSWLKHRANYRGPVSQAVIARARERGDRRLLRLLGVDDRFVQRANCGFREPDEENWRRWIAEDTAARTRP